MRAYEFKTEKKSDINLTHVRFDYVTHNRPHENFLVNRGFLIILKFEKVRLVLYASSESTRIGEKCYPLKLFRR